MQVRKLQKHAAQQVTKLKSQLKVHLKKHPMAAKYAKEPYLTWILYGITAITVTTTWALGAAVLGELSLWTLSLSPSGQRCSMRHGCKALHGVSVHGSVIVASLRLLIRICSWLCQDVEA